MTYKVTCIGENSQKRIPQHHSYCQWSKKHRIWWHMHDSRALLDSMKTKTWWNSSYACWVWSEGTIAVACWIVFWRITAGITANSVVDGCHSGLASLAPGHTNEQIVAFYWGVVGDPSNQALDADPRASLYLWWCLLHLLQNNSKINHQLFSGKQFLLPQPFTSSGQISAERF